MAVGWLRLRSWLSSVVRERHDDGASLIEYALLLALIAVIAVIAITFLGEATSEGLSSGASGIAGN